MMKTPYYAVIFTTQQTDNIDGYKEMAQQMEELAKKQAGYIGIESPRETIGITVSYWESEQAIINWKNNMEHLAAQKLGKETWYSWYHLRICKVEREYSFNRD